MALRVSYPVQPSKGRGGNESNCLVVSLNRVNSTRLILVVRVEEDDDDDDNDDDDVDDDDDNDGNDGNDGSDGSDGNDEGMA
jgi:hypothetical protein